MVARIDNYYMTSDNWTEIVVASVAALSGAGGQKLIDYFKNRKQQKQRESLVHSLSSMHEVFTAMGDVVHDTPVTRFLILKGSNGGGLPKPGSPFYANAVHERHKLVDHDGLVKKYTNIEVDAQYIEMLLDISTNREGKKCYVVSEMQPGLLKSIYKSEGLKYAEVYYLTKTDREIFYASIATDQDGERFEDETARLNIDLAISKIKQVFKKYV